MGVWIETLLQLVTPLLITSHTLYGCVDWNLNVPVSFDIETSHTLYGCVDWNP